MGCALAALWVPDKNISLSLTQSGAPMAPEALQRAQHHLMAWMQMQQRTIVINHISKVATDVAAPFKILACPIRHRSERVMGVLALFNPPSAPDFDAAAHAHRRDAGEARHQHHPGAVRSEHGAHDAPSIRTPGGRRDRRRQGADDHIILYLDIDRLHVINETFGMHVGDDVIASVADCMAKNSSRRQALSARISGDRLAALIPNCHMEARPP